MDFPSVPVYLDHHNWHQLQQPNHQQRSGNENPQLPPPPPPPQVGGGEGSIRPGSMVDRARQAKLPMPEAGMNCPRCDSTNTKFCYFNNYSLTQPRHFCKTCRRYWTRGGALRNVPVGGGCRRNKRNKRRNSKSPITSSEQQTGPNSVSASPSSCNTEVTGHFPQPSPQLPLMAALQNHSQYGEGNYSSNIGGFQPHMVAAGGTGQPHMGYQIGSSSGGNVNILSAGGAGQWRLPFLAGFETPTNFRYQSEGVEATSSLLGDSQLRSMKTSSGITQVAPMKVEENRGLNLSRQFLGISEGSEYWGGNPYTEFSGLNSVSTSQFL